MECSNFVKEALLSDSLHEVWSPTAKKKKGAINFKQYNFMV